MCGIAGICDFRGRKDWSGRVGRMLDTISYRGPDGYGIYEDREKSIYLGHKRLSILDLSENGKQPMQDAETGVCITYNGEVYNFMELRKELQREGYSFRSNSDTEVLLKSYLHWGIDAVRKFRGMFAFTLWDPRDRSLHLVRDRAGVKPLYYHLENGLLLFSSEVRALAASAERQYEIDWNALGHYFQYGYISSPDTIFKGVRSLPPGHYLKTDSSGNSSLHKYWDIEDHYLAGIEEEKSGRWDKRSDDEVAEELEEILGRAFKYRLVSDVPVGVFLSGGIDSSLLAAILAKKEGVSLNTFTIGYEDKEFNEATHAKITAQRLGTNHTEMYCTPEMSLDLVDKVADIYDEPFGDNSAIPTYIVSRLARKSVKVALSADGGDELFCGYSRYNFVGEYGTRIGKMPGLLKSLSGAFLDVVPRNMLEGAYNLASTGRKKRSAIYEKLLKVKYMLGSSSDAAMYEAACTYWQKHEIDRLLVHETSSSRQIHDIFSRLGSGSVFTRMMAADFKKYMMDDVLTKLDRASMAVSLETREPFLDHDLVEYAARMPLRHKYRNGENKYILKKILYKYLPESDFRRPKQGFSAPVGNWLKGPLRDVVMDSLSEDKIRDQGIFNPGQVAGAVNEFYGKGRISGLNIWYLLQFQMWYKRWMV